MNIIRKAKSLKTKKDFYKLHLSIINPLFSQKLTDKEITVLASFMSMETKLIEEDMFNTLVRKKVREENGLSQGGLGNHLKSMLKKGFLTKHEITGRIKIKDYLVCEFPMQGYQFLIKIEDEENRENN